VHDECGAAVVDEPLPADVVGVEEALCLEVDLRSIHIINLDETVKSLNC